PAPQQLLRGRPDGLQTGAAQTVDREGRRVHVESGAERDTTGDVRVAGDLPDGADDHLADARPVDSGPLQRLHDRCRTELVRRRVLERPAEPPHRRPSPGDDRDLLLSAHQPAASSGRSCTSIAAVSGSYSSMCRSSGPLYAESGRISAFEACCSRICAVQPVTRAAMNSGVKVSVSYPMRL